MAFLVVLIVDFRSRGDSSALKSPIVVLNVTTGFGPVQAFRERGVAARRKCTALCVLLVTVRVVRLSHFRDLFFRKKIPYCD